jgi:hypothetical protein
MTSTSSVARTAGAASSLIQRWIVAPPTKTISSASGPRMSAASSSISVLVTYDTCGLSAKGLACLLAGDFADANVPCSDAVDDGE